MLRVFTYNEKQNKTKKMEKKKEKREKTKKINNGTFKLLYIAELHSWLIFLQICIYVMLIILPNSKEHVSISANQVIIACQ